MKKNVRLYGSINRYKQLCLYQEELKEFLSFNPSSKIILDISIIESKNITGLRSFYFNHVIKRIRDKLMEYGDIKTLEETDLFIRSESPIMYDETYDPKIIGYNKRLRSISEINYCELKIHVDFVLYYCATNLNLIIDEY